MAENINEEAPNFGIQDTMEMVGNTQLIEELMASEVTGNPDDVKPIIETAVPPVSQKKSEAPKVQEITPSDEEDPKKQQNIISEFLGKEEGDEDEPIQSDAPQDETPPADDTEGSPFTTLTKELLTLGVFTTEEGETEPPITTGEEFLERFKAEKQKGAIEMMDNFIGQFGEDYQNAFEAIFVKGVHPKEYFGTYNKILDFANLDMTVEENQIAVIRQGLLNQGFEAEDITTEIERLKVYGDLQPVATKHHKVLVRKEADELRQKEVAAEQELKKKAFIKTQYIQNVNAILQEKLKTKEFDGIPLNPKLASELQEFLLQDKWRASSGETLTDFDRVILDLKRPENHALKVKIALLIKILEKDPTLSTIQRAAVTKKTDQVFSDVARQVTKITSKQTDKQQPKSWFQ